MNFTRYTSTLTTFGIILLFWCAAVLSYWAFAWFRVGTMIRQRPTIRAGLNLPAPGGTWPSLSIIVPVHNEQRVIEACIASLREQDYPNLQIIIVLDRCTDRTGELLAPYANDPRLVIVDNQTCPKHWAGKCNAAQIGANHARGEWLLFTDADTQFDPNLARAAVALAASRGTLLLSLLSTLSYESFHERVAQPVATMNLVRMFPLTRLSSKRTPRPFANGQFMLFERSAYDAIGGHAAVKDALLEDLAFARLVQRDGGQVHVALADGMLRCSMYDSLAAFKRGWGRIFIEACTRRPRRLRRHARRILLNGIVSPLVQFGAVGVAFIVDSSWLSIALLGAVGLGWVVQVLTLMRIYSLGGAPLSSVLSYPLGCWIVARVLLQAARDLVNGRPIRWGGREYVLQPR